MVEGVCTVSLLFKVYRLFFSFFYIIVCRGIVFYDFMDEFWGRTWMAGRS